ncbi:beta-1,3-galactosyltransferase 5-like isoform X2 [Mya arenaria]|uniref:beta-1,3-galactosyltransferase 5-like isoform X2 n=1 Tax=Mya arenaria TaxID=6604 RepID=UPI0022E20155|nr:beta-1,3-galactosyltransferase 5-like isoform X2 [Mya arenaria]
MGSAMFRRRRLRGAAEWVVGTVCLLTAFTSAVLFLNIAGHSPVRNSHSHVDTGRNLLSARFRPVSELLEEITQSKPSPAKLQEFDKHEFAYQIYNVGNKTVCTPDTDMLVYIHSATGNFMKRRLLRRTWASSTKVRGLNVRTVFILGRPENVLDQIQINNEQFLFGDIIQGNFTDGYRNLTNKALIAMGWVDKYCANVKHVLKADDDIFVNILAIAEKLVPTMNPNNISIACHLIEAGKSPIERAKSSRWYVEPQFFPNMTHFPRFCSGYMVVMTAKAVKKLHANTKSYPVIKVDDAYMFGMLTQDLKIDFRSITSNLTLFDNDGVKSYEQGERKFLGVATGKTEVMEKLWSMVLKDEIERHRVM